MSDAALYKTLGENIRRLRETRGLTQQQLADLIEMSRGYVANIETGRTGVLLHQLLDLATALNAQPSDLLEEIRFIDRDIIRLGSLRRSRRATAEVGQ